MKELKILVKQLTKVCTLVIDMGIREFDSAFNYKYYPIQFKVFRNRDVDV